MTQTMSTFFALLTVLANLAVVTALVLIALRRSAFAATLLARVRRLLADNGVWTAWVVAVVAMSGSLFYSEVANFPPCTLCWYQRIAMYPLVAILFVGGILGHHTVRYYALPLVGVGGAISTYHYLLERWPSLSSGACEVSNPCSVLWVWEFNYISIPFMALSAFALIATLLLLTPRNDSQSSDVSTPDVPQAQERILV